MIPAGTSIASAKQEQNIYDLLREKGFEGKSLFCQVTDSSLTKNINQDVPALLDVLQKVVVARGIRVPEPPAYTIHLEKGSSFPSQVITISVTKIGNGYVEYMEKRIAFFNSVELYGFCATAFAKSEIVVH